MVRKKIGSTFMHTLYYFSSLDKGDAFPESSFRSFSDQIRIYSSKIAQCRKYSLPFPGS